MLEREEFGESENLSKYVGFSHEYIVFFCGNCEFADQQLFLDQR